MERIRRRVLVIGLALAGFAAACSDDDPTGVDDGIDLSGAFTGDVAFNAETCPNLPAGAPFTPRAAGTGGGTVTFTATGSNFNGTFASTQAGEGPITLTGTTGANGPATLTGTRTGTFAGTGGVQVQRAETFTFTGFEQLSNDRVRVSFSTAVVHTADGQTFNCTRTGTITFTPSQA